MATLAAERDTGLDGGVAVILRHEHIAFWACVAVAMVPVWSFAYFPSVDGPVHLYIVFLIDRLAQADPGVFGTLFEYNRNLEPNALVYGLLWLIGRVVELPVAEKIFVSGYWIGFAAAARYFVTSQGSRGRILAFLLLPFGFGYYIHYGFYNFSLSAVLFLGLLGYFYRHLDRMRARNLAVIGIAAFLLAITHLFGFLMFVAAAAAARLGAAVRDARRDGSRPAAVHVLRDGAALALVCLPALLVIGSFVVRHVLADATPPIPQTTLARLSHIAAMSPVFALDRREQVALLPYILLVWALTAMLIADLLRRRRSPAAVLPILLPLAMLMLVMLTGSLAMANFSALPRLLPFFFFLLILSLTALDLRRAWLAGIVVLMIGVTVTTAVLRFGFYGDANTLLAGYVQGTPTIAAGSTLMALNLASRESEVEGRPVGWRVNIMDHAGEIVARERGVALINTSLLSVRDYGYFPVGYRRAADESLSATGRRVARLCRFEQATGVTVDRVQIWPAVPLGEPGRWQQRQRAVAADIAPELRQDYRAAPVSGPLAPVVFVRLAAAPLSGGQADCPASPGH